MTCNDIITSQKVQMKYAHTTTFTVMREGDRVNTFLGLAGMEWMQWLLGDVLVITCLRGMLLRARGGSVHKPQHTD